MSGTQNVNPNPFTKVKQAIAKLGYEQNFQAFSLRRRHIDTIALALPELLNYFWTTVARCAGRFAGEGLSRLHL